MPARGWGRVGNDPAQACLWALVAVDLAIVWSLPVLVGQDLPQHLAYARVLADYADPTLPFQDTFLLPAHPQPYFTAYLLLAPLARLSSVLTACRILYSAYIAAMAAAFLGLVRALDARPAPSSRPAPSPWTCLFGALVPWNPVQCVGFLPFMLSLPAILWGVGAMARAARFKGLGPLGWLALASAVATSLHLVAGACLFVLTGLFALASRTRRAAAACAISGLSSMGTLALWHTVGERGLAELPPYQYFADSVAASGLYDGLIRAWGVQWTSFDVKASFVVATVLGPLVGRAKLAILSGGLAVGAVMVFQLVLRRHDPEANAGPEPRGPRRALVLTAFSFLALAVLSPTAIRLPDDICLLDFRLYVIAYMLVLACLDPAWVEGRAVRVAVPAFVLFVITIWGRQLHGAAGEANQVVRLVNRLPAKGALLALPFHDRSEFLDEDNAVTHYFPVYYTALRGGVTSLFWGKFSHHLPVGYRPGREPRRPPDWSPADFTEGDLAAASHVLVEWPDDDDGDPRLIGAARLRDALAVGFTALGCEGRWCLYAHATGEDLAVTERAGAL